MLIPLEGEGSARELLSVAVVAAVAVRMGVHGRRDVRCVVVVVMIE